MGKGPSTPEPTKAEEANADVSIGEWNEYVEHWAKPVKDWAKSIAKDKSPEMAQATGITNADLAQQRAGAEKRIAASGMNPNSGRSMDALETVAEGSGTAGAGAAVAARQGVEDAQLAGLGAVADIGMGQKTDAVDGIGTIAANSVSRSMADAVDKQQRRSTNVNTIAGMGGVAAGVYNNMPPSGSAGSMNDFTMEQNLSGIKGMSSDPAGYSINNGNYQWNTP